MRVAANGIVTNQNGEILLIERHDTRTLAPPGGGLDVGELPSQAVVREIQEETGLYVQAEQLLGLHYWPNDPHAYLSFYFRCTLLGGSLQTSEESPRVGFFPTRPLPKRIIPLHRNRIQQGLKHQAARPYWGVQPVTIPQKIGKMVLGRLIYPFMRRQRRRQGRSPWAEPPAWHSGAFTVIRNQTGQVLWIKRTDMDVWNLPGGGAEGEEPPWETAVRETQEETGCRVRLTNLTGVYVYEADPHLIFTFTADLVSGAPTTGAEAAAFAWFTPGEEPANCISQHLERVADAVSPDPKIAFRRQSFTPIQSPLVVDQPQSQGVS